VKIVLITTIVLVLIAALAFTYRLFKLGKESQIMAPNIGVQILDGKKTLAPCPSTPNCVCSCGDSGDPQHYISSIPLSVSEINSRERVLALVEKTPSSHIETQTEEYIHYTVKSGLFGFVDDVELLFLDDRIEVRSASRVGHSDLGKNRERISQLAKEIAPQN